jgi:hypothetical protein
MKKVNQLACSQLLGLSASDLAIINAYKTHTTASTQVQTPASTDTQTPVMTSPVVGSAPIVGPITNTAAAGNASVLSKFWSFLKNLF